MYPSYWHPNDIQAEETMRRYRAEAEQSRLARLIPRPTATMRVRVATLLHALAEAVNRSSTLNHVPHAATPLAQRAEPTSLWLIEGKHRQNQ